MQYGVGPPLNAGRERGIVLLSIFLCIVQQVCSPLEVIGGLGILFLLLYAAYLAFPCNRARRYRRAFWLVAAAALEGFDPLWYLCFFERGAYVDPGLGRALALTAGYPVTLALGAAALTILHVV